MNLLVRSHGGALWFRT